MIRNLAAAIILLAATNAGLANTALSDTASSATQILAGHGKPGDSATSSSNPDITVRVLDNGWVERTNTRYGTVATINPAGPTQHRSR